MVKITPHKSKNKIRILTSGSLFDGMTWQRLVESSPQIESASRPMAIARLISAAENYGDANRQWIDNLIVKYL